MTVLYSVNRLLMTKHISLHHKTGKIVKSAYGAEKHFSVRTSELDGFASMAAGLATLIEQRYAFVIRGELLPGANREKCRRLLHDDPETRDAATFAEAPRYWFAVDIDKAPCPDHVDVILDPDDAIEWMIGLLPPELQDANCWWQFTTSQSLPGYEGTLSARLWFWSLVPLDDASLTRWALAANKATGRKIVDPTLYRAVQPHYIAQPIFDGLLDPVPRRCGVRTGLDESVSLIIPEPDPANPATYGEGGFVGIGVDAFLAQIGGERGFRSPMVGAVASYFATNGPDVDPEPIKTRLRQAIIAAPRGGRGDAEIARYLSDRHLNEIVGWVRQHERANPRPEANPRGGLDQLATAVPVDGERGPAVRAVAQALVRAFSVPPELARSLVECWNEQHCTPPLTHDQVHHIFNALALREADRVRARRVRG
jgi:hypothetical protein